MKHVTKTERTAITNGRSEPVYEIWHDEGIFAGVTSEATESELTDAEREALNK